MLINHGCVFVSHYVELYLYVPRIFDQLKLFKQRVSPTTFVSDTLSLRPSASDEVSYDIVNISYSFGTIIKGSQCTDRVSIVE